MGTKSKLLLAGAWGGMRVKGIGLPGCRMLTLSWSSARHSNRTASGACSVINE